tara:strand:- start:27839 stop:28207 length:369 start_codon:yes stop_codon:yes gene_type:complete
MTINITTEEYDMMGIIDRKVLNLLFKQNFITLGEVIGIVEESELGLNKEQTVVYSEVLVVELQRRFFENVECPLFSNNSDNTRLVIHEEAKWVFEQIMLNQYDENGEVVAKVLPNFDMEEYV